MHQVQITYNPVVYIQLRMETFLGCADVGRTSCFFFVAWLSATWRPYQDDEGMGVHGIENLPLLVVDTCKTFTEKEKQDVHPRYWY